MSFLLRCAIALALIYAQVAEGATLKLVQLYKDKGLEGDYIHRGLSKDEFRNALIELQAANEGGSEGGAPTCGGLVGELCKPCENGGPEEFCSLLEESCAAVFCQPLCKRSTWTCNINFGSFQAESEDPRYNQALCSNFINEGCSDMLDCCPTDTEESKPLHQDVQDKVFADLAPRPALPTPGCFHHPGNVAHGKALCDACQSEVTVELTKNECSFPASPSFLETSTEYTDAYAELWKNGKMDIQQLYALDEALLKDIESGRTLSGMTRSNYLPSLLESYATVQDTIKEEVNEDTTESEAEAENEAEAEAEGEEPPDDAEHPNTGRFGDKVAEFPGKASYFSLQTRCLNLVKRLETLFAEWTPRFQAKVCNCMGCCARVDEPVCYFPSTTVIAHPPEAAFLESSEEAFTYFMEQSTVLKNKPVRQVQVLPASHWAERRKQSAWYKHNQAKKQMKKTTQA